MMKCDAVFEGGGVKGIGLVGALAETERQGYRFENVAGTSAGAIVASLVAAGHDAARLSDVMRSVDYRRFLDRSFVDRLPLLGSALSLGFEKGIYEGAYFEGWLRELLSEKGIRKFGDLYMPGNADSPHCRHKLQVIAADLSRGRMLVLPHDAHEYGIDPNELEVARAVRMSMSIPFFFEPVELVAANGQRSLIVDGGVLSNFPVWLFDSGGAEPPWPTFGYKLVSPRKVRRDIRGPFSLFAALFSTMLEAHDERYIKDADFVRTISIPTLDVSTTDFDLSGERRDALYASGVDAAREFFATWDFETYKREFRKSDPEPPRGARLRSAGPRSGA